MQLVARSHKGLVRPSNQDQAVARVVSDIRLLAISDGAGGERAGDRASQLAISMLRHFEPGHPDLASHLGSLVDKAHQAVLREAFDSVAKKGMCATFTIVALRGNAACWAHVGDSRIYLHRGPILMRVTDDHTLPGALLSSGVITNQEAREHHLRNHLLDCVGCRRCGVETGGFDVVDGDTILVCSDGLHDYVSEGDIKDVLSSDASLESKGDDLIDLALAAGGHDNVSAALLWVRENGKDQNNVVWLPG